MNRKQSDTLQSLKEVQQFLIERAAELPGLAETGMRKKFDDTVTELSKLAATQTSAELRAMSTTRKIHSLTTELIEHHMSHIARIAAVTLPPGPELAPLALPKKRIQTGERLAAKARGMATEAQKYQAIFIDAGLPIDFIQQLRDAADALTSLISLRKQSVAERGAATKLLRAQTQEAKKVVRVIDGFVQTAAKGNTKLLVTWKILKRLRRQTVASPETQDISPPSTGAAA